MPDPSSNSGAGNLQAALSSPVDFSDLGAQPSAQPLQSAAEQGGAQPNGNVDFSDLGAQATETAPGTITGQTATISAPHQPTSTMGKLAQWIDNVTLDMKDGGDRTGVGTVLQKLGAHGLNNGNSAAVGDFMASLPLGLMKAAKGAAELVPAEIGGETGNTWKGVKNLVGGGLQALSEPLAFVAPEESALSDQGLLSDAASGASKLSDAITDAASKASDAVTDAASKLIPNKTAAGKALGEIDDAIGDHPVIADDAAEIANDILEKQQTGAKLGGVKKQLLQFVDRATDPDEPLTFAEAREFEQNFQNLTPSQKMNAGAGVRSLLRDLSASLRQSVLETADAGGQGDKFRQAMQAYKVAARTDKAVSVLKNKAVQTGLGIAAGEAGGKLLGRAIDAYAGK